MENTRDFKGVWIPKEIWLDKNLNALDKCIFVEVDSLDNEEQGCFASNEYLAEFCQCSETKVSNAISKLIKLGYLFVKSFDGRQRILQSRLTKNVRQTYKICKADLQNLQYNNIYNNKVEYKKENNKEKSTYGEFKNVHLTDDEYQKLNDCYGLALTEKIIKFFDAYIEEKGYKSKSHYLAIKRWVVSAVREKEPKGKNFQKHEYSKEVLAEQETPLEMF
jgi:hypothetical protein